MARKTRFLGLTDKQSDTLGRIAFSMDGPQHPATIKVLLDRGLLTAKKRTMRDRMGEYTVTDYDVPVAVNAAYCQWCADQTLSAEQFTEEYADRSGVTVESLHDFGIRARPCDCDEPDCEGWQMISDALWESDSKLRSRPSLKEGSDQ